MPRNSAGVYTLPLPPVQPDTIIESDWANTTGDDEAQALTDSLDRLGRGGMGAPLTLADGTAGLPGLTWVGATGTGFYRSTTIVGFSYQGLTTFRLSPVPTFVSDVIFEKDVKITGILSVTGNLDLDAGANSLGAITSSTNPAHVNSGIVFFTRPATGQVQPLTINADALNDGVRLANTGILLTGSPKVNGFDIGYRKIPPAAETTGTLNATHVGKSILATGTVDVPNSVFAPGDAVTIYNNTGGSISITSGITTMFLAGTATTGTRTLASHGIATVFFVTPTLAVISGSGLT